MGFYLSGERLYFLHWLEIVNTIIAGLFLYYLISLELGKTTALFAFFSYALLFNHVILGGWYSRCESEIFFEIPVLAIFILQYYIRKKTNSIEKF